MHCVVCGSEENSGSYKGPNMERALKKLGNKTCFIYNIDILYY